jgi:hypothetical protein
MFANIGNAELVHERIDQSPSQKFNQLSSQLSTLLRIHHFNPPDHPGQPAVEVRVLISILSSQTSAFRVVQNRPDLSNRIPRNTEAIIDHNTCHRLLLTSALDTSLLMIHAETFVIDNVTNSSQHIADRRRRLRIDRPR